MPTYLNTTSETLFIENSAFGPNQKLETKYSIDTKLYPKIKKISDFPKYSENDTLFPIFENISSITNLSDFYTFKSRVLLHVKESSDVPDNSAISVIIFTGDVDEYDQIYPIASVSFVKFHQKDKLGVNRSYWMPSVPFVLNSFEDSADYNHFKFLCLSVNLVSDPQTVFTLLGKLL